MNNELHVTLGDRSYQFSPGQTVRIGRSPENDIVVSDPTVSRQHAQLSSGPDGWEWENVGRALSLLNGQPVTRVPLTGPVEVQLASPNGPVLGITPVPVAPPAPPPLPPPPPAGPADDGTSVMDSAGYASVGFDGAGAPQEAAAPPPADAAWEMPRDGWDADPAPAPAQEPAWARQPEAPPAGHQASDWGSVWGPREPPRVRPAPPPAVDEIATALHILVPIRSWLHDPGWRQFVRLLVIPYGLLPLVFIALFASSNDLSTPGWAYSLYIAPLWAIVFWLLIKPGPLGRREVGIAAGAIVFVLIWIRIVTININGLMGKAGHPLSFPGAIGVGINEEITKVLPILIAALLLLRLRSLKLDVRMWMFLGTLVGLAFGVSEQAGYTTLDIEGIAAARGNSQAIVEVLAFAERVFVDGFQHAVWAGVSAFFIGMAVNYRRRRPQLIAFGIAVPAVLHGLYDWSAGAFASLWIPIIIQAISLFLFLGYTMSAGAIERQVSQTPMFRGESMLMERVKDPRRDDHPDGDQPPQGDPPPGRPDPGQPWAQQPPPQRDWDQQGWDQQAPVDPSWNQPPAQPGRDRQPAPNQPSPAHQGWDQPSAPNQPSPAHQAWDQQAPADPGWGQQPAQPVSDQPVSDQPAWNQPSPSNQAWDQQDWDQQPPAQPSPSQQDWDQQPPAQPSPSQQDWDQQPPAQPSPSQQDWDQQPPGQQSWDQQSPGPQPWDQ